jgi:hypothetical protein
MSTDFDKMTIAKGNLATVNGTLVNPDGTPFDLTGCTAAFGWQRRDGVYSGSGAAVVGTPATAGNLSYHFAAGETAHVGCYDAQWTVTKADTTVLLFPFPGGFDSFEIAEKLPVVAPANTTLIREFYEPVRAALGDMNSQFQQYEDSAIASVVRTVIRAGKVEGYQLAADRQGIIPLIGNAADFARVMYHSAKMFLAPNSMEYGYRTRALQERFGRPDLFYRELETALYRLENGDMFSSFQSFYAWANSLTGINVWALMTDMKVNAPVCTVAIGRAGLVVNTT